MSTVVLDGSTVRKFVEANEAFNKAMDEKFLELDTNQDGVLSRSELRKALESFRLLESEMGMEVSSTAQELNALYDSVFDGFDTDRNNKVDLNEFRSEMKNIMLAIADGLGAAPIQLLLEEGGLLKDAVEFESAKTN